MSEIDQPEQLDDESKTVDFAIYRKDRRFWAYEKIISLYPPSFREEFGDEMLLDSVEYLEERPGVKSLLILYVSAFICVGVNWIDEGIDLYRRKKGTF
jgi:hypothetical protein